MGRHAVNDVGDSRAALDPIEREAHDWVVRFASGEATSDDLREGKLWCDRSPAHAAAFAKASRLWDSLTVHAFEDHGRFRLRPAVVPAVTRRAVLGGAAAAATAAYVLVRPPLQLWPSLAEWSADHRTATGEQRRITVAESVSVEMNTQTSIAVGQPASESDRIELIVGEVLIAAAASASKSLVVLSADGRVSTTGARFNIWNNGRSVRVTCLDGNVDVEYHAAVASLKARQQITYDRNGLSGIAVIDPDTVTAWREGRLIFHATPLSEVVEQVNRYRPGKIILTNAALGERLFSANFHIRNIGSVVGQIERLFGATVTSLPGDIVLLS
jgi:transmembrane sensor